MLRYAIAVAAVLSSAPAAAQTGDSFAIRQVELLAPQLVAFSGSSANFDSLVSGLTSGAPVTLTSTANGTVQIVTFSPLTTLSPVDAARTLEAARQSLIVRGVAAPSAQQIAASLLGGTITTPSGASTLIGTLTGTNTPLVPVEVRTANVAQPPQANIPPTELQAVRNALAAGTGITLVNAGSGGQNVDFAATGLRMSDFEVNQALQLAANLLARQGILDPTASELRTALFGGPLALASGATVPLRGVLEGRTRSTSASPDARVSASTVLDTSASPAVNTSASTRFGTSNTPPPKPSVAPAPAAPAAAAAAPSTAPRGQFR